MSFNQDLYASLPPPEQNGWIKDNDKYDIDWEAPEVVEKYRGQFNF